MVNRLEDSEKNGDKWEKVWLWFIRPYTETEANESNWSSRFMMPIWAKKKQPVCLFLSK
jgi:hypothetical protein